MKTTKTDKQQMATNLSNLEQMLKQITKSIGRDDLTIAVSINSHKKSIEVAVSKNGIDKNSLLSILQKVVDLEASKKAI